MLARRELKFDLLKKHGPLRLQSFVITVIVLHQAGLVELIAPIQISTAS